MDENVVNVPSQAPRTNIWFLVLGVLVVIFLILVGFLYFQTKKVAPITSNTTTTNAPNNSIVNIPKSSNDPTSEPLYTFNCPDNSNPTIDITGGDGTNKPFTQVTCTETGNPNNKARIYSLSVNAKEITEPGFTFVKSFDANGGTQKVFITSNNQAFFDSVVASFKFGQ
ncbi:MAG TPA: hypothetical protein VKC53_04035 [Patescibacteria group bacterium]|nr:hypothetical protein [Patescibacteria group bacterium]